MIPPSWQLKGALLVAKYGQKVLLGLLAVAVVFGGYYYWEHAKIQEGRKIENDKWKADNARIQKDADDKIAKAIARNEQLRIEDRKKLLEGINSYAQYSNSVKQQLDDAHKRLFVITKSNKTTCGTTTGGKADVPKSAVGGGEEVEWAELGTEAADTLRSSTAEVERMAWLLNHAQDFIANNRCILIE